MALEIRLTDAFALPRVAQLTQKTNQFNLTTRRYSEEDIQRLQADGADVIYLRYRDRFGDAGIVGVCILTYDGTDAEFDSFLLSCRILGRGVERAFLAACLARTTHRGATRAIGEYLPTAKNAQVQGFYPANSFSAIEDETRHRYIIDVAVPPPVTNDLFRVDTDIFSR
jgi:FkbH-like protein